VSRAKEAENKLNKYDPADVDRCTGKINVLKLKIKEKLVEIIAKTIIKLTSKKTPSKCYKIISIVFF